MLEKRYLKGTFPSFENALFIDSMFIASDTNGEHSLRLTLNSISDTINFKLPLNADYRKNKLRASETHVRLIQRANIFTQTVEFL